MSAPVKAAPGERFSARLTLTPDSVAAFAATVGDRNPLHHDPAHAATTRYKRLIASGPQTTAHLMALTASHFAERGAIVGLDFSFRFNKPVFADETVTLEWLVVAVHDNARLRGQVVDMRGRVQNAAGVTAVGAKGRILLTDRL